MPDCSSPECVPGDGYDHHFVVLHKADILWLAQSIHLKLLPDQDAGVYKEYFNRKFIFLEGFFFSAGGSKPPAWLISQFLCLIFFIKFSKIK